MSASLSVEGRMSIAVAYDATSGEIVRVHFSGTSVGEADGAKAAAWLGQVIPAHCKLIHLAPGSMEPGKSYRVDVATSVLVVEEGGRGGVSASSGVMMVPRAG